MKNTKLASCSPDAIKLASAISNCLITPNESDSNWEPANVVDGLFAIARAIHHVARAIENSCGQIAIDPDPELEEADPDAGLYPNKAKA